MTFTSHINLHAGGGGWGRAVVVRSVRVSVVGVVRSTEGRTGSSRQTDTHAFCAWPGGGIVFSVFTCALEFRPGWLVHDARASSVLVAAGRSM